ncbi:Pentatricopeptide repeat-containing protein [Heracleum sosnowskyi]|uniref:Pentatricopeptide repeat-containing protein n=1 Tax=Heracleum sosnowskyi TaxID=360622 RepID=A0AAD8HCP1_9APIA|nr:Pentatricopeptide repeat-containing protein [Heracleum sosnowskyi]
MYADCNDILSAHHLFDHLSHPNVFAWTAMLAFYSRNAMPNECFTYYNEMKMNSVFPDKYVLPNVVRACTKLLCVKTGMQIHKEAVVFGVDLNLQICNSLIDMYSKCGDVSSARRVFDAMVERDLLSWNSLLSAYVSSGFLALAIELFGFMRMEGFEPDIVTWNTIMDAYCRMGQCDEASNAFTKIKEPNIISWTTLISGYSRIGKHEVTLSIFREMMSTGKVCADLDCLSSVLVSCRYIEGSNFGREIHAHGMRNVDITAFYKSAGPALLVMYATSERTLEMDNVFNCMDKSDVVTWTAMIHSLAHLGMAHSALTFFREMQILSIQNDQTTLSTILPVCDLKTGKQIHAYILRYGFSSVITVLNALIHMYSKNGCNAIAYSVFLNMERRDVVSWNAMIGGFGMNGFGQAALHLMQEMRHSGIFPNSLTFTSVLSACSHSGLVDEGLQIFHSMTREFGFEPKTEHFACVVDILARAGQLDDAVEFIKRMPVKPDKCIWGAVLSASRAHQNIGTGVLAAENLVQLEPNNAGNYVTLSNMYVRAGRWEDAVRVRKQMDSRNLVKPSGYSFIENGK